MILNWIGRVWRRVSGMEPPAGKLTLTDDEWSVLDKKIGGDPILANAFRLMSDASLLFDNGRYSSVVALAVLSLEEIGKYLLARWSSEDAGFRYDKRKVHQMKQGAIAALFMTDGARKEYKARKINFAELNSPEKMAEFVGAVLDGLKKEARFAEFVRAKAIEVVKWSGIYYDEEFAEKGIEPSKITADNATEIMRLCSRAFMLLANDGNITIARYAFGYIYPQKSAAAID